MTRELVYQDTLTCLVGDLVLLLAGELVRELVGVDVGVEDRPKQFYFKQEQERSPGYIFA